MVISDAAGLTRVYTVIVSGSDASSIATGDNAVKVLSLVARARHAKAVWGKVNP